MNMIKWELEVSKNWYIELDQKLEHQENLMKELIEVNLQEITNTFKTHNDNRFDEIHSTLIKAINVNSVLEAPVTQQSQPTGPANGGVIVEKSPFKGGGS